ncbi:MAG: carboxymuconolactone decarboxylase family protein [Phycisphaerales bacterium]|nr:carboxymuconolactone decarboxylase family protein [Phycisphaerales bacterium]
MSYDSFEAFRLARAKAQARLQACDHLGIKRFLRLDSAAYEDLTGEGGLDERTKELLGLVASAVLRCDDCINYHLENCVRVGWSVKQIEDAMNVALVVGGSITIPHLRRACVMLDELVARTNKPPGSAPKEA